MASVAPCSRLWTNLPLVQAHNTLPLVVTRGCTRLKALYFSRNGGDATVVTEDDEMELIQSRTLSYCTAVSDACSAGTKLDARQSR